jgi:hypothetical protein
MYGSGLITALGAYSPSPSNGVLTGLLTALGAYAYSDTHLVKATVYFNWANYCTWSLYIVLLTWSKSRCTSTGSL